MVDLQRDINNLLKYNENKNNDQLKTFYFFVKNTSSYVFDAIEENLIEHYTTILLEKMMDGYLIAKVSTKKYDKTFLHSDVYLNLRKITVNKINDYVKMNDFVDNLEMKIKKKFFKEYMYYVVNTNISSYISLIINKQYFFHNYEKILDEKDIEDVFKLIIEEEKMFKL